MTLIRHDTYIRQVTLIFTNMISLMMRYMPLRYAWHADTQRHTFIDIKSHCSPPQAAASRLSAAAPPPFSGSCATNGAVARMYFHIFHIRKIVTPRQPHLYHCSGHNTHTPTPRYRCRNFSAIWLLRHYYHCNIVDYFVTSLVTPLFQLRHFLHFGHWPPVVLWPYAMAAEDITLKLYHMHAP